MKRQKVCLVATIPFALKVFMSPHVRKLSTIYDVTLVANGSGEYLQSLLNEHVRYVSIPIERKIYLLKDLKAFFHLYMFFRKNDFACVHSITPKAGLLVMAAARLAGVPVRIHTFTGQVWATRNGVFRFILKFMDKIMAFNASAILSDSPSQSTFLIQNSVVKKDEITVLADGSFAGVDTIRFSPNEKVRADIRNKYNINPEDVVFLFIGRLNIEKGLLDLVKAFEIAARKNSAIKLLIVGPDEDGLESEFAKLAAQFPGRVHRAGYTTTPEDYMAAADVFCLPSYREGFGSVLIEAAAVELPSIASRIYGITDAIEDGVTGILHSPKAEKEMADAMLLLTTNKDLRIQMGSSARKRAIQKFSEERVTGEFLVFYERLLKR